MLLLLPSVLESLLGKFSFSGSSDGTTEVTFTLSKLLDYYQRTYASGRILSIP
jgi:hypothetical protein